MEQKLKFDGRVPAQPSSARRYRDPPSDSTISLSTLTDKFCLLCGPQTGNTVNFEITFGPEDDRSIRVCRYCLEDLTLLSFAFNQVLPFRNQRANVARQPAVLGVCFEAPMEAICHGK